MNDQRRHHNGRPRTRAEERIDALGTDGGAPGAEAAPQVSARVEELERELVEAKAAWQRTAADYANYKRRTEQEREQSLGLANESLLRKLLSVADDFDRALDAMPKESEHVAWVEGVRLVERKLRSLLESEGVTPIEAWGKRFDPHEHEAVLHQETADAPDGTVINELQKGYRIRDRILRPALVAVANNTTNTTSGGQPAATGEGQ